MTMHFLVRFETRVGCAATFRDALLALADTSRTEPGCVRFEILEGVGDVGTFAIHSEWVDGEAFDRHATLPHTTAFLAGCRTWLTHDVHGLRSRTVHRTSEGA